MSNIIEVENLVLTYPDGTKAVDGVTFNVKEGEFFGSLGPNGAGKSTIIKILTTLLKKTSGSVKIAGLDIETGAKDIRRIIGVQSQDTTIDEDLTGRENLVFQGQMQRIRGKDVEDRVNELLKLVELSDVADKKAAYYSGGMKKRLDLASALVHRPRLIFLDEPTLGLDPQSRAGIWKYLKTLNKEQGVTIFLTTQYLEEADKLCDRISIIDQGQIIVSGSPTALKQQIEGDTITVTLTDSNITKDQEKEIGAISSTVDGVIRVSDIVDHSCVIYVRNASHVVPKLVRVFDDGNVPLSSISLSSPTLDDVFFQHTGRRIRAEDLAKRPSLSLNGRRRRKIPFH